MKNLISIRRHIADAIFICSFLMITCSGCLSSEPKEEAQAGTGDLKDFELTALPGSTVKAAELKGPAGQTIVEGYVDANDQRVGQWVEYIPEGDIAMIENYIDGKREGMLLKMTNHGQIENKSYYHQGVLHGPWVQYKFGKVIEERNYNMGKLDGTVKKYADRTWELTQEIQYKDGKQHGFFRHYDADGNVTLEYEYKDGEKISGGIVEKK